MNANGTHVTEKQLKLIDEQRRAIIDLVLETPQTKWEAGLFIGDLIRLKLALERDRDRRAKAA